MEHGYTDWLSQEARDHLSDAACESVRQMMIKPVEFK